MPGRRLKEKECLEANSGLNAEDAKGQKSPEANSRLSDQRARKGKTCLEANPGLSAQRTQKGRRA